MMRSPGDPDGEAVTLEALDRAHICTCDPAVAQAAHAFHSVVGSMLPDATAEANTGLSGEYARVFHGGIDPVPMRSQRELLEVPAAAAGYTYVGDI